MKNTKKELIKEAGFSSTYEKDRLEKLVELTVIEVLKIMANSTNTNTCVYTTYDASIVGCAVDKLMNAIVDEFEINKPQEIRYETIMGRKV